PPRPPLTAAPRHPSTRRRPEPDRAALRHARRPLTGRHDMTSHHTAHTPSTAADTTSSAHLRVRGLRLTRGDRVLLREVDPTLSPGDRLAVVGENGRGKTTLLEALSGDLAPDAGTIERHGRLGLVRQELQMDAAGHRTVGGLL